MTDRPWTHAPMRKVRLLERDPVIREEADGTIYISHRKDLGPYPHRLTDCLIHWAEVAPDRVALADRKGGGDWRRLTYAGLVDAARRIGQALLDRGISVDRPLAILSGNDLEHAMLAIGAMHVGLAYAPISPAYSTMGEGHPRLRDTFEAITPGLAFAADPARVAHAMAEVAPDVPLIGAADVAEMLKTEPTPAVDAAHEAVARETVAKFLFTSGSTGSPKAVPNTHGMICACQEMTGQAFAYLRDIPPVVLDWAPWHHTAGGNANFWMVLTNGGTLYVDDGRPTPADTPKTVRNLKDVRPTWYFNVPAGFDALLPYLVADPDLAQAMFGRLGMLWYAGASMGQHTWDALERIAAETTGERVLIATGLGATETSPGAMFCLWPQEKSGNVGLPIPGVELKLVPMEGRYDARVRGANVMPGYWRRPDLNEQCFDEEGFYRFGDALAPAVQGDMAQGLRFDGRTAENFKLATGTWVTTGALRLKAIDAMGGLIRDLALAGPDRPYLSAVLFAPDGQDPADPAWREEVREKLADFAHQATGSSNRILRAAVAASAPSMAAGELTDKGSLNQRAVLANRAALVEAIYEGGPEVLRIGPAPA